MDPVFANVCDRDDNDRLDNSSADEAFGGLVDAPFHAAKRSRCIKDILSVVQIQNGITSSRKSAVSRRQINQNVAPVPEDSGPKRSVHFDVSR
jgi:hypothetical protein